MKMSNPMAVEIVLEKLNSIQDNIQTANAVRIDFDPVRGKNDPPKENGGSLAITTLATTPFGFMTIVNSNITISIVWFLPNYEKILTDDDGKTLSQIFTEELSNTRLYSSKDVNLLVDTGYCAEQHTFANGNQFVSAYALPVRYLH